jgi:hypothetical protein
LRVSIELGGHPRTTERAHILLINYGEPRIPLIAQITSNQRPLLFVAFPFRLLRKQRAGYNSYRGYLGAFHGGSALEAEASTELSLPGCGKSGQVCHRLLE